MEDVAPTPAPTRTTPTTARRLPIHQVKDHLSQIVATVAESRQEVLITKHGRVVARIVPAEPSRVILGVGTPAPGRVPDVEDLRWADDELDDMLDGTTLA